MTPPAVGTSADRGAVVRIGAGGGTAVVDLRRGGRLSSLRVAGRELLVQAPADADPVLGGCYPMVPWAGRIRDGRFTLGDVHVQLPLDAPPHALHGLGYRQPWTLVHRAPSVVALDLDLGSSAAVRAGWPFGGHVRQVVSAVPDGVRWQMTCRADRGPLPLTVGWHPWFVRHLDGVQGRVDVDAGAMLERGPDGLPTGRRVPLPPGPWDDCLVDLRQPAAVVWPGVGRVELTSDLDHLVVFDGNPTGLCVEPQSGPPDEVNLDDPRVLQPGEVFTARLRLCWQPAG